MKKRNLFGNIAFLILLIVSLLSLIIGPVFADDGGYKKVTKPISIESGEDGQNIPRGSYIHHLKNGDTKVYGPDQRLLQVSKTSEDTLIPVPARGLVPTSHVHYVPTESRICRVGDEIKIYQGSECILTILDETFDKTKRKSINTSEDTEKSAPDLTTWPPPPYHSGWIEYSRDWAVDGLAKFQADWYVPCAPPAPSNSLIVNYIFNAIEDDDYSDIIKPVLENNHYIGTFTWTCAAWYGIEDTFIRDDSGAFATSQGNHIRGTLSIVNGIWKIDIYDMTQSKHSILYCNDFSTGDDLKIFCSLEGYYIQGNSDLAGDINFQNMLFKNDAGGTIDIGWSKHTPGSSWGLTGLKVTVVADNLVKLATPN